MDNSTKVDSRLATRLTNSNWNTEFKQYFRNVALEYGSAGEIIINGVDAMKGSRAPVRNMKKMVIVAGLETEHATELLFPETDRGDRIFFEYKKEYKEHLNNKKKLMSKLLTLMDKEIHDKVTTSPNYDEAFSTYDLLSIWQIVEQSVNGRGAVSVYIQTVKLLKSDQSTDTFQTYAKNFKESVVDLNAQGSPEEILGMVFNTLFVMGLNQKQFKTKLDVIYGEKVWPDFDLLANELHSYVEATERMATLRKDNQDGVIHANSSNSRFSRGCWNCDSPDHMAKFCTETSANCSLCGKKGHIAKYCKIVSAFGPKKSPPAKTSGAHTTKAPGSTTRPGNKSLRREQMIAKAVAHLTAQFEAEDANYSESDQEDDEDEYEPLEPLDFEVDQYMLVDCVCCEPCTHEEEALLEDTVDERVAAVEVEANGSDLALAAKSNTPDDFVLDSGCKGRHICNDASVLVPQSIKPVRAVVEGVTGHQVHASTQGDLHIGGQALVVADAPNLLSLKLLVKGGGYFRGDEEVLDVFNKHHELIVRAVDRGSGFWTVTKEEVMGQQIVATSCPAVSDVLKDAAVVSDESEESAEDVVAEMLETEVPAPVAAHHLSAEQLGRAREALTLCRKFGHTGDHAVIKALDNGNWSPTHLTSQDVRNARREFGPCTACQEGKMKAPSEPTSMSEPATRVGEYLHADMLLLSKPSIGGNTVILTTVDDKSGFVSAVSSVNKQTSSLLKSMESIVSVFNSRGHKVDRMTTDDERTLLAMKSDLAKINIVLGSTPAGLHEKRMERSIQTIKSHKRAVLCGLPYELPAELEAELYLEVINLLNRVPNKQTGAVTPYQMVHGLKPRIPEFSFGQTGLFYSRRIRKEQPDERSEWGIFLGTGVSDKYYRCYSPTRKQVLSKRRFEPKEIVPTEWGFKSRIRPPDISTKAGQLQAVQQSSAAQPFSAVVPTNRNVNVQTGMPVGEAEGANLPPQCAEGKGVQKLSVSEGDYGTQDGSSVSISHEGGVGGGLSPLSQSAAPDIASSTVAAAAVPPVVPTYAAPPAAVVVTSAPPPPQTNDSLAETKSAPPPEAISQRPRRAAAEFTHKDGPAKERVYGPKISSTKLKRPTEGLTREQVQQRDLNMLRALSARSPRSVQGDMYENVSAQGPQAERQGQGHSRLSERRARQLGGSRRSDPHSVRGHSQRSPQGYRRCVSVSQGEVQVRRQL